MRTNGSRDGEVSPTLPACDTDSSALAAPVRYPANAECADRLIESSPEGAVKLKIALHA